MDITLFMQSDLFNWVVMPLLIFVARILDMSLGTLRFVLISKSKKKWAPIVGFFEVFIWLIVVRQIITEMNNPLWMVAYAAGYAMGTYIGMLVSERLNIGEVLFRIIVKKDSTPLVTELKENGFGVTIVESAEKENKSNIIFTVIHCRDIKKVGDMVIKHHPNAFFTIEDVRKVSAGVFVPKPANNNVLLNSLKRKGK
jgi:uncharacterized protein YebE (UPF0316 family)